MSLDADQVLLRIFQDLDIRLVGVQVADRTWDGVTFSGFFDAEQQRAYISESIQPDMLRNRTWSASLQFYSEFKSPIYPSQELKTLSVNKRDAYQKLSSFQAYTQLLSSYDISKYTDVIVLKPYRGTWKSQWVYICKKQDIETHISMYDIDSDRYIIQQYHNFSDIYDIIIERRVVCSWNKIHYIEKKYKQAYNNVMKREYIDISAIPQRLLEHIQRVRKIYNLLYIPDDDIYALDRWYDRAIGKWILIEINASPWRNYLVKYAPWKAREYFYSLGNMFKALF